MIRLRTFGTPSVETDDGSPIEVLNRQTKRLGLLIYLCCGKRRFFRRDELLALFWPESDDECARNCLRQSLHVLRSQLGPGVLLGKGRQQVAVAIQRLESDVEVFVRALGSGCAEAALELYKGEFLTAFYLPELPDFERWVERRRQQLGRLAISAAKQLAYTAEGTRDLTAALHWWTRAAELTPFDETVTRRIVSLLIATGNRAEAFRTLTRFEALLRTELEVKPSRETRALLAQAMDGGPPRMPEWFGDRRRRRMGGPDSADHWRRITDHTPT